MLVRILSIDASTPATLLCLGTIDRETGEAKLLLGEDEGDDPNAASSRLLPRIAAALDQTGQSITNIDLFGCGCGPGTFTGTRVAIATVQGLAIGASREVLPISTLAIVAASSQRSGTVVALLDARRGELYAGAFECRLQAGQMPRITPLAEPVCAPPDRLLQALPAVDPDAVFLGPGLAPHRAALLELGVHCDESSSRPSAAGLWTATCARIWAEPAIDPQELRAVYLRQSYAELGLNLPKRPVTRSPFV